MTDEFQKGAAAMRTACARECESRMKNTERELFSDEDDRVSHICLFAGRIGAYSCAAAAIRAIDVETLK